MAPAACAAFVAGDENASLAAANLSAAHRESPPAKVGLRKRKSPDAATDVSGEGETASAVRRARGAVRAKALEEYTRALLSRCVRRIDASAFAEGTRRASAVARAAAATGTSTAAVLAKRAAETVGSGPRREGLVRRAEALKAKATRRASAVARAAAAKGTSKAAALVKRAAEAVGSGPRREGLVRRAGALNAKVAPSAQRALSLIVASANRSPQVARAIRGLGQSLSSSCLSSKGCVAFLSALDRIRRRLGCAAASPTPSPAASSPPTPALAAAGVETPVVEEAHPMDGDVAVGAVEPPAPAPAHWAPTLCGHLVDGDITAAVEALMQKKEALRLRGADIVAINAHPDVVVLVSKLDILKANFASRTADVAPQHVPVAPQAAATPIAEATLHTDRPESEEELAPVSPEPADASPAPAAAEAAHPASEASASTCDQPAAEAAGAAAGTEAFIHAAAAEPELPTAADQAEALPPAASLELRAPWVVVQDPATGMPYFWNQVTNETAWQLPEAL